MTNLFPLSIPQQEILFEQLIHPSGASYNISNVLEIQGKVDTTILQNALTFMVTANPMLSGKIIEKNSEYFIEYGTYPLQFELNPKEITAFTRESFYDYCQIENQTAINITQGEPLCKFVGVDLGNSFLLFLKFHHIVIDGTGVFMFFSILSDIYSNLLNGASISTSIFGSYQQYIEKQNFYLISEQYHSDQKFWKEFLLPKLESGYEGLKPVLNARNSGTINRFYSKHIEKNTNDNLLEKLQSLVINDFHYALMVLALSLKKVFNLNNPIICLPMANRWDENAKKTLGHFVSSLPFIVDLNTKEYPENFITSLKNVLKKCYRHKSYFHSHIVRDLQQNFHEEINIGEISFSFHKKKGEYQYGDLKSGHDLLNMDGNRPISIYFGDNNPNKGPRIDFIFGKNLFTQQQSDYFTTCFEKYYLELHNWLDKPFNEILSGIELLEGSEKSILLNTLNSSPTQQTTSKTIVDLFAAQVAKMPNHVALVHKGKVLTLSELHSKSNQLANFLLSKDLPAESIIGLLFEPSFEMMIGILGVLKAGYAYLPIESDLPETRKGFMLKDCNCTILLGKSGLEIPKDFSGAISLIDIENLDQYSKEQPNIQIHPDQLAYIIYTSGTTGQPKGAMLTHQNIANYTQWFVEEANISAADKTILLASYAFDGSYTNIYSCFVKGCTLFLASRDEVLNVDVMLDFIEMNEISFLKMTPTYFNTLFITVGTASKKLSKLRLIVIGGEAIRTDDVEKFHAQFSAVQIMNHYGPTETTVGSVFQMIDFDTFELYKQQPTIGKPIASTQIYLLDEYSQLVPYGVEGEIYIGGDGLARGYLNREDLTKEKFIDHPYKPNVRIYRTGDIGRWMPDGNLGYLGRKDEQVKIRGYRIELAEIESVLLKHEGVESCVVVANKKGKSQIELVAYVIGAASKDELHNYLNNTLPTYMIPTFIECIESIPYNSNGKVNKKLLPTPKIKGIKDNLFKPVVTLTEKNLAKIWSEVLEIPLEQIHLHSNFFELGGNSIFAVQLLRKIKTEMQVKINLKNVYTENTILLQSIAIDKEDKNSSDPNLVHFCTSTEQRYIFNIPTFAGFPGELEYLFNNISGYNVYGFIYTNKEDFINYCAESIIKIAQNATYISLIGTCTGGQQAFSIVQKLEAKGVKVDLLLMYDSKVRKEKLHFTEDQLHKFQSARAELLNENGYRYTKNENIYKEISQPALRYMCNHVMQGTIKSTIINLNTLENIFKASVQKEWKKVCIKYYTVLIHGIHSNMLLAPFKESNSLFALNIYNLEKKGGLHLKKYLYKEKIKNAIQNIKQKINSSSEKSNKI
jgi:amino acid adenylation domain-containing protein